MRIHLARHGQALSFGHHKPLSPLGEEQVRRLARRLHNAGFVGRVYASPHYHTLMSGQISAEVLETRVAVCREIREIVGDATYMSTCFKGATAAEMRALFDRADVPEDMPEPWWTCQHETGEDVERRVAPFIDSLCETDNRQSAFLIGHGASVNAAIRHLIKRYHIKDARTANPPPCFNATLTTFVIANDSATIEHYYDSDHLPADALTSNAYTAAQV